MKLRLTAALLLLPILSHAQAYGSGVDGQSVFQVSETRTLNYTGTASRTLVLPSDTRVVRYAATTAVHKKEGGSTVTATTNDTLLPANTPEYFKVLQNPSRTTYISAIQDASGGVLYIDLMKP
ncbi:hypothetical protein ABIB06_006540 [Bradyrhizobium sp. LB8.2]|uniref:hypothetical protein n=1 Tax=unclassified Bradyrhizobium TaxID=2631580 RepID=UPI00339109A1